MRVGVYVGSFNPVHEYHMTIAKHITEKNIVDKVIVIPTLGYWDKQNLVDLNDRIKMLKFYESEKIKIDTMHNNLEYTYQILDALKKETNDEYYLIIGADNLETLHLWKEIDKILENKILVINRDGIEVNKYIEGKENFILVNDLPSRDISSTYIRKCIATSSYKELKNIINEKVLEYIIKNKIYKWERKGEKWTKL